MKIRADRMDGEMDGFATGLTTALTKDGQTTPTANLPMGTFAHTGVGNATARNMYLAAGQLQDGGVVWADGGGTADAITATYAPAITTLVNGMLLGVRATTANTTATPDFSPNGLTARTIVKEGGQALLVGDIRGDGHDLLLRYDLANTRWELLNPAFVNVARTNAANTFSGANTFSAVNTFSAQVRFAKGSDVASANALTLGTDGNYFDITGTTAITSIGTLGVGTVVKIHFDGALTLTHHATDLILPSGANITTAAGDEAEFVEYASGDWRCTNYQKASGLAVVAAAQLWEEIASGTLSNDATLDITFDDALYRQIRVILTDILPATDGASLNLLTSTDGGSNYANSANNYQYGYLTGATPSASTTATVIEVWGAQGNGANEAGALDLTLFDPQTAAYKRFNWLGSKTSTGGNFDNIVGGGARYAAADVDAIRFLYSSGNIASGRYRVIGLRE